MTILYGAAGLAVFGGVVIGGAAAGIFSGFRVQVRKGKRKTWHEGPGPEDGS